eukprot:321043_1
MSISFLIVIQLFSICSSVIGNWISGGQATKHPYAPPAADSSTACGYLSVADYLSTHTSSFPFGYVAAVGTVPNGSQHENLFNNGVGCGACYEIKCDGGSFVGNQQCICNSQTVVVQAIDLSAENSEPHFDMSFEAFDIVAGSECGRISIQYRQVACEFNNNIYITTDNNDEWSYYLNFYNVAGNGKLCSVELKSYQSNTWMQCTNIGSKWKCDDAALEPTKLPLSFRIADCVGNKITVTDVVTKWGVVSVDLGVNFPINGAATDTTTNPTPQPTNTHSIRNLKLKNKGALSKWWYAGKLYGLPNGYVINKFEIEYDNGWIVCSNHYWAYTCDPGNNGFSLPLSVRITAANNEQIIAHDIILNYDTDMVWDLQTNFGIMSNSSTITTTSSTITTTSSTTTNAIDLSADSSESSTTTTTAQPTNSARTQKKVNKEIIGYYPSWQWYDRNRLAKPQNLDFSKLTIINFAFFQTDIDGNIYGTDSWADKQVLFGPIQNWPIDPTASNYKCSHDVAQIKDCNNHYIEQGLIYLVHLSGGKIFPSIGGWTLSDTFPVMAASSIARNKFAKECVELIKDYDFDGIDIDWEYPGYAIHKGTSQDKDNFNLLLQEIRNALDDYGKITGKYYELTAALPCGMDHIGNIDIPFIYSVLDQINLMT